MRAVYRRGAIALAIGLHLLFAGSLFAGLDAPLLWQDEAETAMYGRSVLAYGVPKIHVDRNVLYGAPLPLELGRNEALDAYLGSPWGQYFFAAPAVAWSDRGADLAVRTWRVRLPFAIAGWFGVLMLGAVGAGLWPAAAGGRVGFWFGYGACLVLSVSLQLHLREVRYYPLVVFVLGAAAHVEARRTRSDPPALRHALVLAPILFALFNLFYAGFAAVIATSTGGCALHAALLRAPLRESARVLVRSAAPYALACAAALPLVALFRLPEQSRTFFATFRGPGSEFSYGLGSALYYLMRYEFLLPAAVGAAALAVAQRRLASSAQRAEGERRPSRPAASEIRTALAASILALALAIVWLLLIARTPLFFSRYVVALSPMLSATSVLTAGYLVALRHTSAARTAMAGLVAVAAAWLACAAVRGPELRGRVDELREPYRGPLDYAIPYLAARHPRGGELVIATNYEDFSYMFYLGATTVLGYYAPDRKRDLELVPDVIVPRPWPVNMRALEWLAGQQPYEVHEFPVANVRVNNLPELSPLNQSGLVHRFSSPVPGPDGPALQIGERRQP